MDLDRLSPEELEAFRDGGFPLSLHPHEPFVFIGQLLSRTPPVLVHLWERSPELRGPLVHRWCVLARRDPWVWNECDALLRHVVWKKDEIPEPLRLYTQVSRPPGGPGRHKKLPQDLVVDEIAATLEADGYTRKATERAIGLFLAHDPAYGGLDESTVRKARARARNFIAAVEAQSAGTEPSDEVPVSQRVLRPLT